MSTIIRSGTSKYNSGPVSLGSLTQRIPGVGIALRNSTGIVQGGGLPGLMPQQSGVADRSYDFERTRLLIREAWNNAAVCTKADKPKGYAQTPFRMVMNAGDPLSRQFYSCGGPCQTPQSSAVVHGTGHYKHMIGSIKNNCNPGQPPPSSCNTKYVYDCSDYTRYRREMATRKNYNDISDGGDQHRADQFQLRMKGRTY